MKKKFAFNLIDVIVVIAIGLLACGIIWRQELTKQIELRDNENTVDIVCNVAFENTEKLPEDGSAIKLLAGNSGTLSYITDESGNKQALLSFKAVELESGYYLANGTKLLVEKSYVFHCGLAQYSVKVLSVEEMESGN